MRQQRREEILRRKIAAEQKEAAILAAIPEDQPPGHNLPGERGLISAIFVQALNDMLACPHPDPTRECEYTKESFEARSLDAMRFVSAKNKLFCLYCHLLDIEPEYMEKSIYRFFRKQVELKRTEALKPKRPRKVEVRKCSANIVTILSHLLSELLVMIMATRYYVAENVRDAA